jgi:hypothetical protein
MYLDLSGKQKPLLLLNYTGLSYTWPHLDNRILLLDVSTTHGSELHLNLSKPQRHVLHLDFSTSQGLKLLHMDPSLHNLEKYPIENYNCTFFLF